MAVNPGTVTSPVRRLSHLRVIHQTQDWSLAIGVWDRVYRSLLVRWNGDIDHPMGNPVSHGHPTWFVLPEDFHAGALALVPNSNASSADEWLKGGNPDWID